jgi:hypothetical protein
MRRFFQWGIDIKPAVIAHARVPAKSRKKIRLADFDNMIALPAFLRLAEFIVGRDLVGKRPIRLEDCYRRCQARL